MQLRFVSLIVVPILCSVSFQAYPESIADFYLQLPVSHTVDQGTLTAVLPSLNTKKSCESFWQMLDPKTEKIRPEFLKSSVEKVRAQQQMIACGKWMFFYLPLPSQVAVPNILVEALTKTFPQITGKSFSNVGFRDNPREPGRPLEMPVVPPVAAALGKIVLPGGGRTLACTGCHLGTLPSGEFSVGMPNDNLDLGLFNTLTSYPMWLASRQKSDNVPWDKQLHKIYEGMWKASVGKFNLARVLLDATVLIDLFNLEKNFFAIVGQDPMPLTDQRTFYKSGKGSLNPATPMLSEPQHEIYVSTSPIWNMKHHENKPMGEPYLGRVVSSRNLEEFIRQAYVFSTLETQFSTPRYVDPMAAYVRSLRAPKNPIPVETILFEKGEALFAEHCASCHNGTEGATANNHPLADTQSPQVFDQIFHDYVPPTRQSKQALAALQQVGMLPLARSGVKSRRFNGLWARNRLTTNGAVQGIDALFCLNGKGRVRTNDLDPQSDGTHLDLCINYDETQRNALKEFLTKNW